MPTAIPHSELDRILQINSSPETIVALLNEAEISHSSMQRISDKRKKYPRWKLCKHCKNPFLMETWKDNKRRTCSEKCARALMHAPRPQVQKDMQEREVTLLSCEVCGKEFYIPNAWIEKAEHHYCSQRCNGIVRGKEFAKHAHRGRAAWNQEAEQSFSQKMSGKNNPAWKGGVTYRKRKGNYGEYKIKYVRCPEEYLSMTRKDGYVMEHRLKVSQKLGRPLRRSETVHHIDHNPENNEISNLMLFKSNQQHKKYEAGDESIEPLWQP